MRLSALILISSLFSTLLANPTFRTALLPEGAVTNAVKLDAAGSIFVTGNDIAVSLLGEAFVTGWTNGLSATPGAAVAVESSVFVAKLNAQGSKVLLMERGVGGSRIALDSRGDSYPRHLAPDRSR